MKTQSFRTTLKTGFVMTLLAAILSITSCGTKDESAAAAQTKTDVKPPKIDIHTAVLTGNLDAVKQHIAAGTNINERDPFGGSSPLITASLFNKQEMAIILIKAGADINFQNNDGATALHLASFFCRPEIVKVLLDNGADKTIKNKFGATPYESVAAPFAEVKNVYDMMGQILTPMGLKLDYPYLEKTRPEIASMLK